MKSILSLPAVLQEVWSRVYAAALPICIDHEKAMRPGLGLASPRIRDAVDPLQWAESHAWEAVRRANGGEMPETTSPPEPTDEEMIVALAPIVAKSRHGDAWDRLYAYVQAMHINDVAAQLRTGESTIARVALASWKAARAWGRK